MEHGFQGKKGQTLPDLPDDFRAKVSRRYIELYEKITGTDFKPSKGDPTNRIQKNIQTMGKKTV
jgi:phosphoribosylaminoimidazole-succinocarboxamide synthase